MNDKWWYSINSYSFVYEIRKVAIYLAFELLAIYFNFNILFEVNVKVYTWAAAMGKDNFLNHL